MTYTKLSYSIATNKPYLFIGSKIRGMLGYPLKESVCINPSFECKGCFAAKECVFYKMYEEQSATHLYRLNLKLYDQNYKFSILLFGELQNHAEQIDQAMLKALENYHNVEHKTKIKKFKDHKHSSIVKITFQTPLRIKKENRFATKDIELLDLLRSIQRRAFDLKLIEMQNRNISEEYKVVSKNLHYKELTRKSNKQNTKMNMGGIMGEMVISNCNAEHYKLLKLGEVIGVGKATTFGLGKIKVEDIG